MFSSFLTDFIAVEIKYAECLHEMVIELKNENS